MNQTPDHNGEQPKKKPKDNRDALLYHVYTITPARTSLGKFRLDAKAECGDIIEVQQKVFVIKKVQFHYKYQGGAYRMYQKAALVKEASRDALDRFMDRLISTSDAECHSS